jgi:nitrite reductase (NADH) large subunit
MPRMLDTETAAIAERVMRERGVDVQLGDEAMEFVGDTEVRGLRMAGGTVRTADLYIAATGVKPNVDFLRESGITAEWGVHVDDRLRTSAAGVYACGDVAEAADRMSGERYVHAIFPNAVAQAEVVARNLCGDDVAYAGAESMNSLKHLGVPIMAVGAMEGEETFTERGGDWLRKVFVTGGRIVGFRLTGDVRAAGVLRTMMLRREDVGHLGPALTDPALGMGTRVWTAMVPGLGAAV